MRRFLLPLLLAGCATSTAIKTPDGIQHLIECDGSAVPWSACYKKAAEVCPAGYRITQQNTGQSPYSGGGGGGVAAFGAVERKSLMVQCQ